MKFAPSGRAGGHRVRKCGTCRDRGVKCDNQEPPCVTCTSRGFKCKGYAAPDAFITVEPGRKHSRGLSRTSNPSSTEDQNRSHALVPVARPESISSLTLDPLWNFQQFFLRHLIGNAPRLPGSGLPSLLCGFLDKDLPVNSMQYTCMKALTASYYLRRTEGPSACQKGMETYGHALNAVRRAVKHPYHMVASDVLMSIMCLCLYENIVVTSPRFWIEHYKGISRIIEMHGPSYYHTGSNREILMACRYTIIVSAGTLRHPCFLAQQTWRSVIEPKGAESCDVFGALLNTAVDVPGLLHGLDCFTGGQMSDTELAVLSTTLQRTMLALQVWWCTLFPGVSASNDSSPVSHNASAIAFHHMVLLLLEDLCYNLKVPWRPRLSLSSPATSWLDDVSSMVMRAQQRHALANEILLLARGSICNDTGVYGVLSFIMSLHVAYDHLIPGSPERHALHNFMNTVMAEQHGFGMGKRHDGQYTSFSESLSGYQGFF